MARKLYWGSGSAFCWRVQIVLEEKGLEYESMLLSFSKGEHKGPEVMALNPRGQVPTFVDGDVVVGESPAACLYLESTYRGNGSPLIPEDPVQKARVLQLMFESQNVYNISRDATSYYQNAVKEGGVNPASWATKKAAIRKEWDLWEKYLQGHRFLVGDTFTMADVFFYPFLATGVRYGADLEKAGYPALASYAATMAARETVARTAPPHWKEGPGVPMLNDL
eukprot:TRINITY_DN15047_c0_g1_i1.p1 TRINITY_DN15047_c0_g1~~TRINITY_DN15047_c0_g1_i1.p1  ORF type:complete len:223 (+),score=43.89 TRINITY_DN15047_c0_g1_i1:136-804(+)